MYLRCVLFVCFSLLASVDSYGQTKKDAMNFIGQACTRLQLSPTTIQDRVEIADGRLTRYEVIAKEEGMGIAGYRKGSFRLAQIDPSTIRVAKVRSPESLGYDKWSVYLYASSKKRVVEFDVKRPPSEEWIAAPPNSFLNVFVPDEKTGMQVQNAILCILDPSTK